MTLLWEVPTTSTARFYKNMPYPQRHTSCTLSAWICSSTTCSNKYFLIAFFYKYYISFHNFRIESFVTHAPCHALHVCYPLTLRILHAIIYILIQLSLVIFSTASLQVFNSSILLAPLVNISSMVLRWLDIALS